MVGAGWAEGDAVQFCANPSPFAHLVFFFAFCFVVFLMSVFAFTIVVVVFFGIFYAFVLFVYSVLCDDGYLALG